MSYREDHHVVKKQTIKQAISAVAIKAKRFEQLTEAEQRLLDTPLNTILADHRNLVRKMPVNLHHRAHHGSRPYRLRRDQLPAEIDVFAAEYALEAALEHELRLMGEAA